MKLDNFTITGININSFCCKILARFAKTKHILRVTLHIVLSSVLKMLKKGHQMRFPPGRRMYFSPSTVGFLICQMPTSLHLPTIRYSSGSISSIDLSMVTSRCGGNINHG